MRREAALRSRLAVDGCSMLSILGLVWSQRVERLCNRGGFEASEFVQLEKLRPSLVHILLRLSLVCPKLEKLVVVYVFCLQSPSRISVVVLELLDRIGLLGDLLLLTGGLFHQLLHTRHAGCFCGLQLLHFASKMGIVKLRPF